MQVILLEKIDNVGVLGDLVNVKSGFARNFLLPQGKAEIASKENVEAFKVRRAELEKIQAETLATAEARKEKIDGLNITVTSRAGTEGKLFGSIGTEEIRQAVETAGHTIEKREIRMPEGPLRSVGEHPVLLHLHADVDAEITVIVVGDEG
ncbi:MAG: 50S ribosomal protein L9 [Granulosicoccus sp.]